MTDKGESIRAMLSEGVVYNEIASVVGCSKATISYHARVLGLPKWQGAHKRYDWGEIQRFHDAGNTRIQCIERFGFNAASWDKAIKSGKIIPHYSPVIPIEELLVDGRMTSRGHLKNRLAKEGYSTDKCWKCGISEWQGEPLSMHLHHINGKNMDNRVENIQILCPNCHSQTDTFAGRNARKSMRP